MTGTKCRGLCSIRKWNDSQQVKGYKTGQKFCSICNVYSTNLGLKNCPCCNVKLRTRSPHSQKRINSKEGKRILKLYNLTMRRLRAECELFPHYTNYDKYGESTIVQARNLIEYLKILLDCWKKIARYRYERDERLENKRDNIIKQIENIDELLTN